MENQNILSNDELISTIGGSSFVKLSNVSLSNKTTPAVDYGIIVETEPELNDSININIGEISRRP